VFDNVLTGCRRVRQFISIKRTFVSLAKAVTLVLVLFILMQLAEHQPSRRSISDCSKKPSSKEFISRKILTSSANNKHLEFLILLQDSLINIKSKAKVIKV
jgi:hypothetical protein